MTPARWPLLAGVAAATLAADQATKLWALRALAAHQPHAVAGSWLRLTLAHNQGAAFGVLPQAAVYLTVASAVIAIAILFYARVAVAHSTLLTMAVAMLLGGALGNLADRLRLGYVVDFIDLRVWPVFNLADVAVTAGVALVVVVALMPGQPNRREDAAPTSGEI
jgi:signal peptidase II